MEELSETSAVANSGFLGCAHARPGGKRQVLLVDRETLEAMNLQPGTIRENITTDGLNVNGLKAGEQLQKVRAGLRKEMWGRRGMFCRVIEGGTIRRGDSIERVLSASATHQAAAYDDL
jgi:MOSC domain-containing protein YiiM